MILNKTQATKPQCSEMILNKKKTWYKQHSVMTLN